MEEAEFEALVARVWEAMPDKFKSKVANVALLIEDEPSPEVREEEGMTEHETLLGLYHGIPNTVRGVGYGVGATLPDTITLYRLPLLEEAGRLAKHGVSNPLEEAVRETIWHEVGHYFGFGEEHIHAREEEGTNRFES